MCTAAGASARFWFLDQGAVPRACGTGRRGRATYRFRCTEDHTIDRGKYGKHSFETVELCLGHAPEPPAVAALDCRLIRRGRGVTTSSPNDLFLITTCQIEHRAIPLFLDQFDAASRYMVSCSGMVRFRLYQSLSPAARFQFINIAQWRSADEFVDAFAKDAFKNLIKGGFDHTSQIIVAKAATP